jgi:ubiquinone/menaquinone biosynthesis C-methylase UbiE
MRDMALWLTDPFHFEVYAELGHSIRTGETVPEKIYGLSCFDYLAKDKEVGDRFNNAMTGFSAMVVAAALDEYDFSWLAGKTLVDIAGGHGKVITEILKKHPDVHGVLFDLEHVVAGAKTRIESQGLSARCAVVHGDFFKAVPEADAYVMKHIIHDWDDERASLILKNIQRAARPGARVVLFEAVLASGNEPHFAKWIDIEMLVLPGGRERTEQEYRKLFADAGFKVTKILPTKSALNVIEAVLES